MSCITFELIRARPSITNLYHTIPLIFNITIISLIPSLLLLSLTFIFRNSYGALSPKLTSSLSHLPLSIISSQPWLSGSIKSHWEETLKSGIGIDMDQLGSAELKQVLIRGFVSSLSTSMAISIALGTSWWLGSFVLVFSYLPLWFFSI